MSPTTRSRAEISRTCPSRRTLTCGTASLLQCGDRLFRAEFLIEAKDGVQHDDREDGNGVVVVAHCGGDHRRHDKKHDHRRGDLFPGDAPRVPRAAFDQLVWTISGQPSRGFRARQPLFRVCAKPHRGRIRIDLVPGLHLCSCRRSGLIHQLERQAREGPCESSRKGGSRAARMSGAVAGR